MTREVSGFLTVAGQRMLVFDRAPGGVADRLRRRLGGVLEPAAGIDPAAAGDLLIRGPGPNRPGGPRAGRGAGFAPDSGQAGGDAGFRFRAGRGEVTLWDQGDARLQVDCSPASDITVVAGLAQLSLVRRAVLPLHASVVRRHDMLIGAAGGPGTGKTTVLLALRDRGAAVVAAEWIHVHADGSVAAASHPVRLRAKHLREAGTGRATARSFDSPARLALVAGVGMLAQVAAAVAAAVSRVPVAGARLARQLALGADALGGRAWTDVDPAELGASGVRDRETLGALFVLDASAARSLQEIQPAQAAVRLAAAFEDEMATVFAAARRFAAVTGRLPAWQPDPAAYRDLLAQRLAGVRIGLLGRPSGTTPSGLADALEGFLG